MLNNEDRKFAIEDARTHLAAQFELIKFHDQKAVSLLSLYVTLGIAAVGLALTTFTDDPLVGSSAAWGLAAASASLFVGALYCFRTIERSTVSLPGRGFDFWKIAATHPDADFESAAKTYLIDGVGQMDEMRALNVRLANRLRAAKGAGIAAPLAAAIVGVVAELLPWAFSLLAASHRL